MQKELLKILDEYRKDLIETYGEKLISCYLYGSAVTPAYVPGVSDLNFLVILSEVNVDDLKAYSKIFKKWQKKKISPPIIATREYILNSLDVFPLEFSEIKDNHFLVYGEDIIKKIEIPMENLRLQVESELKGKLLKFRQGIIFLSNDTSEYREFFLRTIGTFIPVFRGVLRLYGEKPPFDFPDIAAKLASLTGFDKNILDRAWEVKKGAPASHDDLRDLLYNFHEEVEKLIALVDRLKVK